MRVFVAWSTQARLLGLALLRDLPPDCALVLPRCSSVHTFGMRFCLDIVFLDEAGGELSRRVAVPANRVVHHPGAAAVLERRAHDVCSGLGEAILSGDDPTTAKQGGTGNRSVGWAGHPVLGSPHDPKAGRRYVWVGEAAPPG